MNKLDPKCSECILNSYSRFSRQSRHVLNGGSDILFLLAHPTDDSENNLLNDTKRLRKVLEDVNIDADSCSYSYIINCIPKCFNARTQVAFELSAEQLVTVGELCKPEIFNTIEEIGPHAIVVMGFVANKVFANITEDKDYLKALVKPFKTMYRDNIPVYHLTDLKNSFSKAQTGVKINNVFNQLQQIKKEVIDLFKRKEQLDVRFVTNKMTRHKFLQWLKDAEAFAFDVETTTGDADLYVEYASPSPRIYTLGIGDDKVQWIIPLDTRGYVKVSRTTAKIVDQLPGLWENDDEKAEFLANVFLLSQGKFIVGQNAKFDNKYLKKMYGASFKLDFDTMLAHHLVDENTSSGLKEMAHEYLGAPDYDIPKPIDFGKYSLEEVMEYNAWDIYYTFKLYKLFEAQFNNDEKLKRLFYKVIMPSARAFELVEERGIYVDPEVLRVNGLKLKEEVLKLHNTLEELNPSINWNSTKQLGDFLFGPKGLGVEPVATTPKGAPSVSESSLKLLRDTYPDNEKVKLLVGTLLDYRGKLKLTQFLDGWVDYLDKDHRMHPRYLLHGTVTGRLSCRDPNLQQVPRDVMARSCITAEPGWILGEADYSQIELRVAAELSGDKQMQMCFNTGIDIHRLTASRTMGVDPDEVTKDERKKAKAINFGFLYGMGAKKFMDYAREKYEVHISLEEAKDFRKRFFNLYSGLPSWHARQMKIAHEFGFVRNKLGRIRHLAPDIYSEDTFKSSSAERQSINSPVQSFASDMTQISIARITNELPQDRIRVVGTVHDSILFEVREDSKELCDKVYDIMTDSKYIMENFDTTLSVPIDIEIKLGAWGKAEVYEPHKEVK